MNLRDAMTAAALTMTPACAAAAGPTGGQFEMFDIAVNGDRIVGRFLEEQGAGPARTCSFTFTGRLGADERAAVTARGLGGPPAAGTLSLRGDELTLSLPQVNRFGGCFLPQGAPLSGSRTSTAAWTDLARVTAPRARFRTSPSGKPGARYVVRGDVVGVLRQSSGALLVEYASGERAPVRGWINSADARSIGAD